MRVIRAMGLRGVPACVALMSVAASAAETSRTAETDDILVTGKRIGLALDEAVTSGALGQKKLLDTPFSVTVVDTDDIFRRQAASVSHIFFNDPSISSWSPSGTTNWWGTRIRGLQVRNYYINDVPLLLEYGGEFPLEPIETVTALKGLTGFMYGFGSPGGVIQYQMKKPTDRPMATTTVGFRDSDVFLGHLDAGGRAGPDDAFGYRVNVAGEYGDAYTTAGMNRKVGSLALDYRINRDLTWYANALYEESKTKHEPFYFYWDLYEGDSLPDPTYNYRNVTVDNSYYDTETLVSSTGLQWQLSDAWKSDVTLGYSSKRHRSNKMFGYILNEAGDYQGEAYNFTGLLKNYFSRVMLQGQADTGAIRHELVVGASYQRNTVQWGTEWYWENDFNGNLYERQPFRVTRDLDFGLEPISEDERQIAMFASDTLHFGAHWQAIVGLRYTDYEQKDRDRDPSADSRYTTDDLSPTLALIFKPASHVSIYGSYVESLEAGSRVGELYANFGELLDATISKQYELGAKYEKDRLSFTTAAFRVERAAKIDEFRDGLRYLTQNGMTVYDGLELIGSVDVTADLTVGVGATYLDAELDEVSPDNQELKGNVPAGVGDWQLVGNIEYKVPAIAGLSVHGAVRYFDSVFYEDANRVVIPDHTLASVGFQYDTVLGGRAMSFAGSVNNLFNEKYWDLNQLGEGRNGSLSVRVNW